MAHATEVTTKYPTNISTNGPRTECVSVRLILVGIEKLVVFQSPE